MAKVFVGMSGGVDSSVAAALLVEQGHDVTGIYMKNWAQDLPGMYCPWAEDVADAKRVAVGLGIDFQVIDFQDEYKQRVVDYMVEEYKRGRTPNPDVMCNQEIKFKLFLEICLERGADMIATGHYARISENDDRSPLKIAVDEEKDQTYFLYRVSPEALKKTIFPLGDYKKSEVREMAKERGLWTATKKESMGICFVGQVGIREFLEQYVELEPGDIICKETGEVLGRHDSAILYTVGQRHGLNIGGGLPYYVVGKDIEKNLVYASQDISDASMWCSEINLSDFNWLGPTPDGNEELFVRLRHRGKLHQVTQYNFSEDLGIIHLEDSERAVAPGQSAVFYSGETVLGGGIIV